MPRLLLDVANILSFGWYDRRIRAKGIRRTIRRVGASVGIGMPRTEEGRALCHEVEALPFWCHSIDLGLGVVTPGVKTPAFHAKELEALQLPGLRGKSVLDIGAWDGFYSFAAEQRGAERVVALDHFVWALDWEAKNRYKADCKRQRIPPQPFDRIPGLWRFDTLPGKRGFDLARQALNSRVESVVCDLMTADVAAIGQFDVVLYLGVLYHMENPLESLRRVRQLTREVAVIETEAVAISGFENRPFCEFFPPKAKLSEDPTNFWAPNAAALMGLCEAASFSRVEVLTRPPTPAQGQIARYRLIAHAFV
jgi:tRNA (mo5U34)-methyltransferase